MTIIVNELCFKYMQGTPLERTALKNINLKINRGELVGIIGHTGSGKSTLVQHFNGLLKPFSGDVLINDINTKSKSLKELREKVGFVFQYPEHQLFEENVYKDIAYGLIKKGFSRDDTQEKVRKVIKLVRLEKEILEKSPLVLSGGQKRRVAIAGVLVLEPEILVMDEPSSGLDSCGRRELYDLILKLNREKNITIIIVSHNVEEMAKYVDRVIVMNDGKLEMDGKTKDIFAHEKKLENIGLVVPQIAYFMNRLKDFIPQIVENIINVDEAVIEIQKHLGGKKID